MDRYFIMMCFLSGCSRFETIAFDVENYILLIKKGSTWGLCLLFVNWIFVWNVVNNIACHGFNGHVRQHNLILLFIT